MKDFYTLSKDTMAAHLQSVIGVRIVIDRDEQEMCVNNLP